MTILKAKPVNYRSTQPTRPNGSTPTWGTSFAPRAASAGPAANIVEEADRFRIDLAVPGLDKSAFKIELDEGVLYISADQPHEETEGEVVRRREFGSYAFKRSFRLGKAIDTTAIEAAYERGILSITLPKREEAKEKPPRKIAVV